MAGHQNFIFLLTALVCLKQRKFFCCSLAILPDFRRNDPVCGACWRSRFPGLSGFSLRPLNLFQRFLLDISPDDLKVSCQNSKAYIPLKSMDAMIRAQVQAMIFQAVDGKLTRLSVFF